MSALMSCPLTPPPGEVLRTVMEGLFLSRDSMWGMLRKVWQPTFHSDSLAGYAPVMAAETQRLVRRLGDKAASGEVTNIWRDIGEMTMSVVGSTAYGVDLNLLSSGEEQGVKGKGGKEEAGIELRDVREGKELVQSCQAMFASSEIGNATRYLVAAHLMPVMVPFIRVLAALFPDERYKKLVKVGRGWWVRGGRLLGGWGFLGGWGRRWPQILVFKGFEGWARWWEAEGGGGGRGKGGRKGGMGEGWEGDKG